MQQLPIFKIHASASYSIVTGLAGGITEKQQIELEGLLAKPTPTFNQKLRIADLEEKKSKPPELSVGAKTFVEEWLKSALYYESYEFTSKQTDKGNECEPEGIKMVCDRMGYGFISKNEQQFEDEYMIGTPDVLTKDIVEEIKCPYTSRTFPLFATELPDKAYYWQQQVYMNLTKRNKAAVNYCLIDAPAFIVEQETNRKARSIGMIDIPMEMYDETERNMSYGEVPIELRHKRFEIDRDGAAIATIKTAVILCREYIAKLMKDINTGSSYVTIHDPSVNAVIHQVI